MWWIQRKVAGDDRGGATSEGVSETAVAEAWTASGFGVRVRASESSKRATLRKNSSIVTHLVMSIVRVD